MWLLKLIAFLITLPFRLIFWIVGVLLFFLFLPLRVVLFVLGLFGFTRLLQLAILGGIGYYVYRLLNNPPREEQLPEGESEATLRATPST
jgi:hypothetical protein